MTLAAPGMPTAVWLRAAEAALKSAPPDILSELNVLDTDLLDTETDLSAGPGRGQPSALNVMKLITWGDLADASGRLGPAGDVLYYVDCLWRSSDRLAGSAWHTLALSLRSIALSGAMCIASDLASTQKEEFMAALRETAWPPELLATESAPTARAQCLRLRLIGGQEGADPRRTKALSRRVKETLMHFFKLLGLLPHAKA